MTLKQITHISKAFVACRIRMGNLQTKYNEAYDQLTPEERAQWASMLTLKEVVPYHE